MNYEKLYNKEYLQQLAYNEQNNHKKLVAKIKKQKPKQFDYMMAEYHGEAFEIFDCLKCGNCCSGLGPRIMAKDIEKLSKKLKVKEQVFIDEYLIIDEDSDYVFKSMPCPFLGCDNYCFVYEQRPKACSDFPHTNHTKMLKHISLAVKNSSTCPAVFYILEKLKEDFLFD